MSTTTLTASGTFTVPAGVTSLNVSVVDGGGGGGGGGGNIPGGGGAGGGGRQINGYVVTPAQDIAVTIGAGGMGGGIGHDDVGGYGGLTLFDGEGTGENVGAAPGKNPAGFADPFGDASGQTSQYKGGSGGQAPSLGGTAARPAQGLDGVSDAATGQPGDGGMGGATAEAGDTGADGYVTVVYSLSAPSTPTGLAATSGLTNQINVTWNAVAGAPAYSLYEATDSYTTPIYSGAVTSFLHTGVGNNAARTYKVTAYNADAESAKSSGVSGASANTSTPPQQGSPPGGAAVLVLGITRPPWQR